MYSLLFDSAAPDLHMRHGLNGLSFETEEYTHNYTRLLPASLSPSYHPGGGTWVGYKTSLPLGRRRENKQTMQSHAFRVHVISCELGRSWLQSVGELDVNVAIMSRTETPRRGSPRTRGVAVYPSDNLVI